MLQENPMSDSPGSGVGVEHRVGRGGIDSADIRLHTPRWTSKSEMHHFRRVHFISELNWYCLYPKCQRQGRGFVRKADLKWHYSHVHNAESQQLFDCQVPACHRRGAMGFGREAKLVEHMPEVHRFDIATRVRGSQRP